MSLDIHMPFKLFASCLPVRGASRSAICDTQRQELHLIPNELYDLLQQYDGGKISTILDQYDEENAATVVEYFEFLYDKELIFFTPVPESFPPISLVYESPVRITNAIIDTDPSHARLPWRRMAAQLSALGCGHLEIRCFSACSVAYFIDVLRYFDDTRIRSIDLIMRYTYDSDATISFLLAEFPRVTGICFHGSPDEGSSHEGKVVYLRQLITGSDHCGIISPGYFAINIKMFAEAQRHNTCLNQKVSIDVDGAIKNCPSMKESYGNIHSATLIEAVLQPAFQRYWSVHKDSVKVCRDCEFRYVCTDCRAFIEDPGDLYSKPLKCGYDPYSCQWDDWTKKDTIIPFNLKFME